MKCSQRVPGSSAAAVTRCGGGSSAGVHAAAPPAGPAAALTDDPGASFFPLAQLGEKRHCLFSPALISIPRTLIVNPELIACGALTILRSRGTDGSGAALGGACWLGLVVRATAADMRHASPKYSGLGDPSVS